MKKAWEITRDLLVGAQPVILAEEDQSWSAVEAFERTQDLLFGMKWKSGVPGSGAPERVLVGAVQSMENMGYDVTEAEVLMEKGLDAERQGNRAELIRITCALWNLFGNLPRIPNHPSRKFRVYESFSEVVRDSLVPGSVPVDVFAPDFTERIKNGWLAQIVGGAFGTAIEGYTPENLKKAFGELRGYVRKPNTYNDDITYELAFLEAFASQGYGVTSRDIALEWVALVPFGWSAEEIALKNLEAGIFPPESGWFHNPYREWIGAQMRGAICGMAAPGNPRLAADLAFRDGVVSHHNNGVLGEIFNAVLVSLAFVSSDVRSLLVRAIRMIPKHSEYRSVVDRAFAVCQEESGWEAAWKRLEPGFERYNWIHAYPNAAAEVLALWYGNGDFESTIRIIGACGYDVDCNAAQILTVLGIQKVPIPFAWSDPVGTEIDTYCRGKKHFTLDDLAETTVKAVRSATLATKK